MRIFLFPYFLRVSLCDRATSDWESRIADPKCEKDINAQLEELAEDVSAVQGLWFQFQCSVVQSVPSPSHSTRPPYGCCSQGYALTRGMAAL